MLELEVLLCGSIKSEIRICTYITRSLKKAKYRFPPHMEGASGAGH